MISLFSSVHGWPWLRRGLCGLIFCLGWSWTAPPVSANKASEVTFDVTVIHASRSGDTMDPALRSLEAYLRSSFKQYRQFKRLQQHDLTVRKGQQGALKLPDDKVLQLKYLGLQKGFVKVRLSLDTLDTTLDIKDGGLFFQAGRVFKDGIIVLAISARTKN